jgi:hypothetical protein
MQPVVFQYTTEVWNQQDAYGTALYALKPKTAPEGNFSLNSSVILLTYFFFLHKH